ncbi:hypothetical protein [Pedobacter hartonius]|uniref:Uncharacterized protein n=1 Tax=Pedobacter hartonius TaxID=425514 RepID=A0A1H4B6U8_9SPHI|nr:hypothetical protein [Pedobacter hartonius]SEA43840.1 hypothetical protein SAMN05443550_103227 [Pedobacter hartonius]
MRVLALGCLLLVSFEACSLFRQTTKTKEEESTSARTDTGLRIISERERKAFSNMLTFKRDSGSRNYTVQVWPLGNFTFSPERGFEGQAEKVLITGQDRQVRSSSNLVKTQELSRGKTTGELKQSTERNAKSSINKTESSPSWKWIIGITVLVCLILIWRFKPSLF